MKIKPRNFFIWIKWIQIIFGECWHTPAERWGGRTEQQNYSDSILTLYVTKWIGLVLHMEGNTRYRNKVKGDDFKICNTSRATSKQKMSVIGHENPSIALGFCFRQKHRKPFDKIFTVVPVTVILLSTLFLFQLCVAIKTVLRINKTVFK